jgi:hypothetical protein
MTLQTNLRPTVFRTWRMVQSYSQHVVGSIVVWLNRARQQSSARHCTSYHQQPVNLPHKFFNGTMKGSSTTRSSNMPNAQNTASCKITQHFVRSTSVTLKEGNVKVIKTGTKHLAITSIMTLVSCLTQSL